MLGFVIESVGLLVFFGLGTVEEVLRVFSFCPLLGFRGALFSHFLGWFSHFFFFLSLGSLQVESWLPIEWRGERVWFSWNVSGRVTRPKNHVYIHLVRARNKNIRQDINPELPSLDYM
jgi:hypothetical protein